MKTGNEPAREASGSARGDSVADAYREKQTNFQTWSGLEVKSFYGPQDVTQVGYEKDLADPGQYPYTRGIYPDMYRGRLWSRRQLCGFGSPEATNDRIKFLVAQGESAVNIAFDIPTNSGVDGDHPLAQGDIGLQGMPISTLQDMDEALADLPLDKVSVNLSTIGTSMIMAFYLAAAKKRGFDFRELRGTILNDTLGDPFCGYKRSFVPPRLALRQAIDLVEYCIQNVPKWNPLSVDGYNIRENGVNAPQEIAFTFGLAKDYIREGLRRGLDIDELAPRITFTASAEMDFFEEICKLRAARRLWARIVHDEFGGRSDKALKYKFHVHTAGASLTRQQPLNNLIRVTIEAMAGILGGTQSLHTCSYDENMGLPTEESVELAVRTQQILAYESRIGNVADPLAGSYYVESLTTRMEEEIQALVKEIDDLGGMAAAMDAGWTDKVIDNHAHKIQMEIEKGERSIVGVNTGVSDDPKDHEVRVHEVPAELVSNHIERLRNYKKNRDQEKVAAALKNLRAVASRDGENMFPAAIEAVEAGATLGELNGYVREGFGFPYDDFGAEKAPF